MKTTVYNEAVFPLELGVGEYVCTRPSTGQWQEYIIIKLGKVTKESTTYEILARDRLHLVDHRKEIGELKTHFDIIAIHTYYPTEYNVYKVVFEIDLQDRETGEVHIAKIENQKYIHKYKCFDSQVLYA